MRLLFPCIAFVPALVFAQSDVASIQGKAIDSVTGQGVRKAVVTLRCNSGGSFSTLTGPLGEFRFDNLQAAECVVSAEAEGYSLAQGGGAKPFTIAAGQQLTRMDVTLTPLGVITGKVVDENGEPLEGASVSAMTYVYNNLHRTLQQVSSNSTDDRGVYRLFDIPPGRYYLSAESHQPLPPTPSAHVHRLFPEEGYARVFFPGAADATQASPHNLEPGEQWTGADFTLHKQPTYHIRGRVNPSAQVMRGGGPLIEFLPCNPDPIPGTNTQSRMGAADGSFDIPGLVPGNYCLILREPMQGAISFRRLVTVKDADIEGLTLSPQTPFSIKGSITFDGAPPDRKFPLGLSLSSADGLQQVHGQVASDLSFQIDNVFPGKYFVALPQWPQFYAKSILYGGQDVSNGVIPDAEPGAFLTISMGADHGEIDGSIQSDTLESGAPVTIAVTPDDAHIDRGDLYNMRSSTAGGSFSIPGLAPGDYRVFALAGQDYNDAHNPDLLKLLTSRAALVTVHANGREQVSLTPIPSSEIERARDKIQ
jgi:hypothetical protein